MPAKDPKAAKKEARRLRAEIACAECRRLKIRCDKKLPCTSCFGRGCAALCPLGTIPPGDGTRFVSAAADHLSKSLTDLEERMHALEDALAILHSIHSPDVPHPLLVDDGEQREDTPPVPEEPIKLEKPAGTGTFGSAIEEQLGALHIDKENGSSRYFGNSGGSESLLLTGSSIFDSSSNHTLMHELDPSYLPDEINLFFKAFPFTPSGIPTQPVQLSILSFLPPDSRAINLVDAFLENLGWMTHIVSRSDLVDGLIPAIYHGVADYGPHDLALLLISMAVGSLLDLSLPPYNEEAQHYYRLARAALGLQPVMTQQSVATIKALHLMSIYMGLSGKESNLEASYALLYLAVQIAMNIGMHTDPDLWGFTGPEAHSRRLYFWNLIAGSTWQALVTGRPPGVLETLLSCRIPTEEDILDWDQPGNPPLGFGVWGFRSTSELLMPVAKAILSTEPPSYDEILALDKKIRFFTKPQPQESDRMLASMTTFVRSHHQDLILLFLHRGHFAQACNDYPDDPMKSPYHQSVLAAYRAACHVISDTLDQFSAKPVLCARVWRIWSYAFSAAVIVGTIAVRCQHVGIEPEPLEQFEKACVMFRDAAQTSSRAQRALPILQNMYQKAHQAHQAKYGPRETAPNPPSHLETNQELAIFGGKSHLVASRSPVEPEGEGEIRGYTPPAASSNSSQSTTTGQHSSSFQMRSSPPSSSLHPSPTLTTPAPVVYPHGHSRLLNIPQFMQMQAALPDWLLEEPGSAPVAPQHNASHSNHADFTNCEGLYREIPETFSTGSGMDGGVRGAPDHEWSAFMHNYGTDILGGAQINF